MTRSLSFSSSICSNAMVARCSDEGDAPRGKRGSELEAGLTRGVGQSANAPVIEIPVAVEDDLVDALREEDLGDRHADLLGGVALVRLDHLGPHVTRERRRVGDGL